MFTGIVTDVGKVISLDQRGDLRITMSTQYDMDDIDIGASVACSGVCLTIVDKGTEWIAADASDETLSVTTLKDWSEGQLVNFERPLKVGDELGGHIVSGHVDCVGEIVGWESVGDSIEMTVRVPADHKGLLAEKGSIAVDGVSLTINKICDGQEYCDFSINLIPHTQEVTAFRSADTGTCVNIEFDTLARYVARLRSLEGQV